MTDRREGHRRAFLRFLAGSPLGLQAFGQRPGEGANSIASPDEALNVMDFEDAAHRRVSQGHWAYAASGVDDDAMLRANHEAYGRIQLRPRRLRDSTRVDIRVELFGIEFASPIYLCPIGGQKSFHADGEAAVARAARASGTMMVLSNSTSTGVEETASALGRAPWYQLYAPSAWQVCEKIVRRVEVAGCPVIALTVDNTVGRNSESYLRNRPKDLKQCETCHKDRQMPSIKGRRMYDGIDMTCVMQQNPALTWEFVDRLRKATSLKLFIKGIETREDALLCLEHGIDGVMVSNHGGRSTETGRATIEALPEVVESVGERIPVFVDGGVRRGTDVFKAMALGATAVGIGRPYLWGLGAFGQAGVERVVSILQAEFRLAMASCGAQTPRGIDRSFVITRF